MRVIWGTTDITNYITSIKWGGSKSQVARKLEIEIVNAPYDPNIKALNIKLADKLYLFEDDSMKTELFRGFVVTRERDSQSGSVSYTAYDLCYYTIKSSATYNFKNKTAETITQVVCDDLQIPTGSLAKTGHKQKLLVKNCKIYDIIMKAYTQAHQVDGEDYIVKALKGQLCVVKYGATICTNKLVEGSNVTRATFKETLDKMVNRVRIYDGDGKQIGVVSNSSNIKNYGVFQQTYTKEKGKNATTTAKSKFHGVDKTAKIEAIGFTQAVTGNGIVIQDGATGLKGLFWITEDTHKWVKGVHTMTLSLEFKKSMDAKEV